MWFICVLLSRYCEFLILHYDISVQSARVAHAAVLSSQLTQLLKCTVLIDSLSPPSATPISPTLSSEATPTSPSSEATPMSSPALSSADSSDDSSLAAELAGLSLAEVPGKDPVLCDLHSAPSICGGSCCSVVWLRQALRFVSIASQNVASCHMTSHVARVDRVLGAACDLLTQHWQSHGDIDLSPVGIPTLIKLRVSKVKRRGKKVKKAMKVSSTRLVGVKAELVCARARCLLADRQAVLTQQVLRTTLADIGRECRGHESSLALARLHYYMGVALAQQLEEEEAEQDGVWFEDTSSHLHEQCVEEFMMCYQLCFPTMPTILLRETCLWLALLLTGPDHTHHFLSLSQHIALMHETVVSLGKKLR